MCQEACEFSEKKKEDKVREGTLYDSCINSEVNLYLGYEENKDVSLR